ncbi:MAG: transcription termination factor Rho, partial [Acidimicrobiales bacterium]
ERKERDELHAIATAMALKPPSRSRKADIIDLILTATGVGPDAAAASGNGSAGHANGDHANGDHANGDHANGDHANRDGTNGVATVLALAGGLAAPAEPDVPARPRRSPRVASRRSAAAAPDAPPTLFGGGDSSGGDSVAVTAVVPAGASAAPVEPADRSEEVDVADGNRPDGRSRNGSGPRGLVPLVAGPDAAASDEHAGTTAGPAPGHDVQEQVRPGEPRPRTQARERPQHAPHQPQAQTQAGPSTGYATDAGNRRGRRRRGRERGEVQAPQEGSSWQGDLVPVKGLLDLREEGYGFLRTSGYLASSRDVYVSVSQARKFALRKGDAIEGACRPAGPSEKYPALLRIDTVGGLPPEEARQRPRFEDLTPLFPDSTLRLEQPGEPSNMTARIVDLISPIGKGQRGMIVSPPKAGKTTIMKQIAHSIEANNPDVHLIVLLVDERPEEVTDIRRSVRGEVIASTFDRPADEHTAVAELTIERAKRLVELGRDVVIILDGITRLARAYNLSQPATGRIMSGGVDSGALYPPKRFFGAARNIEEGGSLTILASALVETGSKMDEVIFEEFKGTGNMELRLDRKLAERRLYPAIDVNASSTRHEELLFDRSQLQQVWKLRRVLNALSNEGSGAAGLELLIDKIRTTRSNDEFLAEIAKAPVTTA